MSGAARHSLDSAAAVLTVADLIAQFDAVEIWRKLAGFPYEVSSWGQVRRLGARHPLRPGTTIDGYHIVCLCKDGKKTMKRVNRLVAEVFLGPPPFDGADALHGDGKQQNNRVSNIRWGTTAENNRDQDRHGTRPRGHNHGCAKLTEADIPKLDRSVARRGLRPTARRFGIDVKTASDAVNRVNWKHVPREGVAA